VIEHVRLAVGVIAVTVGVISVLGGPPPPPYAGICFGFYVLGHWLENRS
jgi:hypothetical protein